MADLFISYARNDATQVEALAELLERAGWSVWWDRRITTGSSFDLVIEQALAEAKAVVVAWSKNSVGSEWVRAEAAFAIEKKKLVPVRLDATIPPLRFTNVQTVDLAGWDKTDASAPFRRLIADLSQLIGPPPEAGAPALATPPPGTAAAAGGPMPKSAPKPARRRATLMIGVAAAVVIAAVGAVLALRGGSDHPARKAEEVPPQASQVELTPSGNASVPTPPAAAPSVSPPAPAPSPPPAAAPAEKPEAKAPASPSPPAPAPAPAASTTSDREIELAFWKSIKDSTIAADFEAYLDKYPKGDFAAVAHNRLAALRAPPVAAPEPAAKTGPELDVIDDFMVAVRAAPLREGPDIMAKQVGRLKDGERVRVAGKVKSSEWYAIKVKGDTLVYAASVALEDVAAYEAQKEKAQAQEKAQQAAAAVAKVPAPAAAAVKPATLPRAAGVGAYNGTWRGTLSCEASANGPAFETQARPFTFADGRISGDYDVPGYGSGGHETYSGSVDADGNVMISGSGQNSKVGKYPAQFSGKINGSNLDGTGRMGLRHCTFSYRRF